MADDENDDEDVSWLDAAAKAAGFCVTPPEHRFDPALDSASLQSRLEELASLQHAAAVGDDHDDADDDLPVDLKLPFRDADLLRAYSDEPCETLVITFGGLTQGFPGQLTPGSAQFEFVGALRRIGCRHALFARDPMQSWYIRRHAPDEEGEKDPFASLMRMLRQEIASQRPTRVVIIGASMGGYAAIRAGIGLCAHLVIGFGPQVFLHPEQRRHLQLPWHVMDSPLEGLRRDAGAVGIQNLEWNSLTSIARAAELAASAATTHEPTSVGSSSAMTWPRTRIVLHVGGKSDLFEARLLQEAVETARKPRPSARDTATAHMDMGASSREAMGDVTTRRCLSVEIHHHRRHGHNVAFQMREDGFLEPLLRAHLAPLGAARGSDILDSVAHVVASDNNGDAAPQVAGSRPAASREKRLALVRRANSGQSVWMAREEKRQKQDVE